jgi:hypothetical protein
VLLSEAQQKMLLQLKPVSPRRSLSFARGDIKRKKKQVYIKLIEDISLGANKNCIYCGNCTQAQLVARLSAYLEIKQLFSFQIQ